MKIEEIKVPQTIKLDVCEEMVKCAVIGDLHIKLSNIKQSQELLKKCYDTIKESKVTFVVILGDILDSNEKVNVQAHGVIEEFVRKLNVNKIHTFMIIGNHDYINNSQFHTESHIFTPFKGWKNVTVVDSTTHLSVNNHSIIFTPYVQPGRFIESLNTLTSVNEMWENASCIFAHQEVTYSTQDPDIWTEENPPIVSGHRHKSHKVGKNVYYPGSPISHSISDEDDKFIWTISFDKIDEENEGYPYFFIEKHNTNMRKKICKEFSNIDSLNQLNFEDYDSCDLTVKVCATPDEFKAFKKGEVYAAAAEKDVAIIRTSLKSKSDKSHKKLHKKFEDIITEHLDEEDEQTQSLFKEICLV
ncbi:MAG TPA: metallophosphoesterase [Nitrosarchaeum sp.]|nr:metallophosphoesterase [Nitrosarchaeum sp.]